MFVVFVLTTGVVLVVTAATGFVLNVILTPLLVAITVPFKSVLKVLIPLAFNIAFAGCP